MNLTVEVLNDSFYFYNLWFDISLIKTIIHQNRGN